MNEMNKKLERAWRRPNHDKAEETSNHLSEGMFELVTIEKAVETAAYWRDRFEKANRTIQSVKAHILSTALHDATKLTDSIRDIKGKS